MKHDYDSMSTGEIGVIYRKLFGCFFAVQWNDDIERHRQEIIDCIESGTKQDMSKFGTYDHSTNAVE